MNKYFGIGIENVKNKFNYGTLYRTACILGASFIFIIGKRFKHQSSDTIKSWTNIPLYRYIKFDDFYKNLPYSSMLVGIEISEKAVQLEDFSHPNQACYLLGSEDYGLSKTALDKCTTIVKLQGNTSLNVSVAGSIVIYDRLLKQRFHT